MPVGFLINTKKKADTRLTVVMWCQIFCGKSIMSRFAERADMARNS